MSLQENYVRLADEIEQWGISNAEDLDLRDRDRLRRIWSVVRRSDEASLDILNLTHDDGSRVIELFDLTERPDVASTLNRIVTSGRRRARDEGDSFEDDGGYNAYDEENRLLESEHWESEPGDIIDARDPDVIADDQPLYIDTFDDPVDDRFDAPTASALAQASALRAQRQPTRSSFAIQPGGQFFWLYLALASLVIGALLGAGLWFFLGR